MSTDVIIRPMTEEFIVWRCLHGGPLSPEDIDSPPINEHMQWEQLRSRNTRLLRRLIQKYGTCAMLAMAGESVVGILRLYPKALWPAGDAGFCMQQFAPAGPAEELVDQEWPTLDEMSDKTLRVHCLMTGSPQQDENPYQHHGIGTRLVQSLILWAKEHGWLTIEATAHQGLPVLWEISGGADQHFWQRFGFVRCETYREPWVEPGSEFHRLLQAQAAELGMDPSTVCDSHRMRLELTQDHSTSSRPNPS